MNQELLLEGISKIPIKMNNDNRGLLAEIYRKEWAIGCDTLQWNAFYSCQNAFRGMRVHAIRTDYVVLLRGTMTLCLHDIRHQSKTFKKSSSFLLKEDTFQGILIPPGVVHGFYFHENSTHLIGVSHYHDRNDELGCRWDSPNIQISLDISDPILSNEDATWTSYEDMIKQFNQKKEKLLQIPCELENQ